MSTGGSFDDGDDVVWTLAQERTPSGGCHEKFPGRQFVAIGTTDRVDQMSKGTTEVMGVGRWWAPYATVDIDEDGTDEVVLAYDHPRAAWAIQIWLYRQDGGKVEPVWAHCGDGCRYAWNTALGKGLEESGTSLLSGLYCGAVPARPDLGRGLVFWQVALTEPTRMYITMSRLERSGFLTSRDTEISVSGPDDYPPTGERSLCGSHPHQPPQW